jgi:pimeloyl-ACP methyl ester carboxylesterase
MTRRRSLIVAFALVLICGAILVGLASRVTPHVREQATAALSERFHSDVDLELLQVSAFPRPEIRGTGLTLRHNGRTDVPPLIRIGSYSASAGLFGLLRSPLHLNTIELERLEITIPPGGLGKSAGSALRDVARPSARIVIDRLTARTARLELMPRDRSKLPRAFAIHDLIVRGLGEGDGATFEAALTNPIPRGEISTRGTFGPWQADDPGETPLRGDYVFSEANLDTIKGIAGTLSSRGSYSGVLDRIRVTGDTDTPKFSIDTAGQPVHLKTRFQATVDGTNGDTWLERVEARVNETLIVARGAVVRARDVKGRRIALEVTIDDGRLEDVLKLGVKSAKPLMTGRMRLRAKFLLPAGDQPIIDKLELAGDFRLDQARFSNIDIQASVNRLSRRGKGDEKAEDGPSVVSRMSGHFRLQGGTMTFSDLSFGVPGAVVQIAGTYDVKREALDFRGHLLLDASLADTTSGWKAVIARVAQPLFRRPGGGTKLPIRISGPREKPEFGLDVRRALGPG